MGEQGRVLIYLFILIFIFIFIMHLTAVTKVLCHLQRPKSYSSKAATVQAISILAVS